MTTTTPTPIRVLTKRLMDAGIPIAGVQGLGTAAVVEYAPEATEGQRTQGAAIVAAFDWSAEQSAIDAAIEDAVFSRQNIRDRADDILAEETAGQAAAEADLATIASGKTAVTALPGTVPVALKNILTGMLNVMERDINRSQDHMKATADVVKLVRHLAK